MIIVSGEFTLEPEQRDAFIVGRHDAMRNSRASCRVVSVGAVIRAGAEAVPTFAAKPRSKVRVTAVTRFRDRGLPMRPAPLTLMLCAALAAAADFDSASSDPTSADSPANSAAATEKTSPRAPARPKKPSSGAPKPPGSQATHTFAATRSVARKLALQALYRGQLNESPWQDLVLEFGEAEDMPNADREYFRELVEGVWGSRQALDTRLAELTDRPPDQLDPVEHAVLLIGLYELSSRPEVPYRVSINEAVGLTKRFGATDGHKFVNAVLDRAARALRPHED